MLLWLRLVYGSTAVPRSPPGPRLPKPYGRRPLVAPGALLVSPFNVKWRFSALAGDVDGSKLCLFSVIMPAKCVSSVSPRFHYRRVAFCFLPLAAILESYFMSNVSFSHQWTHWLITSLCCSKAGRKCGMVPQLGLSCQGILICLVLEDFSLWDSQSWNCRLFPNLCYHLSVLCVIQQSCLSSWLLLLLLSF
jgi:hypothetical protein